MPSNPPSINLLNDSDISSVNKFIDVTLLIGKLLVIVVELVAIMCFVYRFSLDQRLINLNSEIKNKQEVIASLKKDEDKYRNLQDRIALAATFSKKGADITNAMIDITALVPEDVEINNIFMDDKQTNMNIQFSSISSLSELLSSLRSYSRTQSISINDIENKESVGISLDITTILK